MAPRTRAAGPREGAVKDWAKWEIYAVMAAGCVLLGAALAGLTLEWGWW
jgi:hypothetical protein